MKDKKPVMPADAGCMGCGDCMAICPKEAIRMKSSYKFSKHFKTIDHGELKLPRLK
jgi:ferredoxin